MRTSSRIRIPFFIRSYIRNPHIVTVVELVKYLYSKTHKGLLESIHVENRERFFPVANLQKQ